MNVHTNLHEIDGWLVPDLSEHCHAENMRQLIRHLIAEDKAAFSMNIWLQTALNADDVEYLGEHVANKYHECGTVGCIGGLASMLMLGKDEARVQALRETNEVEVSEWLGIHPEVGHMLFYCADPQIGTRATVQLDTVTREQAIQACINVMTDGAPMWRDMLVDDQYHFVGPDGNIVNGLPEGESA